MDIHAYLGDLKGPGMLEGFQVLMDYPVETDFIVLCQEVEHLQRAFLLLMKKYP